VQTQVPLQPDKGDPLPVTHEGLLLALLYSPLQASLQQVMESQSRSHFFLQAKGRWQCRQIFCGRSDL
jgi:hypothetical protein